jgi:hypothetical protein
MKPKHGWREENDPGKELTAAERAAMLRYRSKLVDMLDEVHWRVGNAPREMDMPRESIQRLLKASY